MKLSLALTISLVGPFLALVVTWFPVISSIGVTEIGAPTEVAIERLRREPSQELLRELRHIGVGAPRYSWFQDAEVVRAADQLFAGSYTLGREPVAITLPFDGSREKFGTPGWDLQLCSFIVPGLLSSAYELTGDNKYLDAAIDYVLAWADFEASLMLPRGYVFNDHSMSARAIIATELWRLYRGNAAYQDEVGAYFLRYIQRLRQLLSKPEFFEYRTNHGFMQSLSLLHLSLAFPELEDTNLYTALAVDRILLQLPYHVSTEGMILEHSAGYQHNGLHRLAGVWRYLGLLNETAPEALVDRYEKALELIVQLLRPDRTLPPIGDTSTQEYGAFPLAVFDEHRRVASEVKSFDPLGEKPESRTIAAASGLAIFWSGLTAWPDMAKLSQTVVHWGNFPTQSHKHADEMGISLWAAGIQWVRAIGSWPYDNSRRGAIGWRSSNAPHWLNEPRLVDRATTLEAKGFGTSAEFIELARRTTDGNQVRRQLLLVGGTHWIVIDNYQSDSADQAEVLWRFSPELTLENTEGNGSAFLASADGFAFGLRLVSDDDWKIEIDSSGDAHWNGGVVSGGVIVPSPAVRATSSRSRTSAATVFTMDKSLVDGDGNLDWLANDNWVLSLAPDSGATYRVERRADTLILTDADQQIERIKVIPVDPETAVLASEENSLNNMQEQYGVPIRFMLERRAKVSVAVVLAALLQLLALIVVFRWIPMLSTGAVAASLVCWLGLSLFLQLVFLA